jgi:hypothetical protein
MIVAVLESERPKLRAFFRQGAEELEPSRSRHVIDPAIKHLASTGQRDV